MTMTMDWSKTDSAKSVEHLVVPGFKNVIFQTVIVNVSVAITTSAVVDVD